MTEGNTRRRKKTVIRSIRLSQELDGILENDAKAKRMNVAALISSVFTKYAEWDRYVEKLDHISMSRKFVKSLLAIADAEKLMSLAEEQGKRAPREAVPFWFKKLDVESFVAWVSLASRYGGFSSYEVESEGANYVIVVNHDLGEAWSKFLERWVITAMGGALGISPTIETSEKAVMIRFTRT